MYLAALAITLAFEVPVYAASLRRGLRVPVEQGIAAGAIVNLISHPLAFLVFLPRIAPALGYVPAVAAIELAVWIFEAALLSAWLRRDADLLSFAALAANALSLAAGLALLA